MQRRVAPLRARCRDAGRMRTTARNRTGPRYWRWPGRSRSRALRSAERRLSWRRILQSRAMSELNVYEVLNRKRRGAPLEQREIELFVERYTPGEIPDYHMSALLINPKSTRLN